MNLVMSKIIELINKKKYQEAELEALQELKNNPNSFELNKFLAISFLAQKKYNPALIAFNKCHEINADDYDINVNLSLIFNIIQDYKSSLRFCEKALKINSNRPEVHHNLANSYLYLSELDKAEKHILKSIDLRGGLETDEIMKFKDTLNIYTDILLAKGEIEVFRKVCQKILDKGIYFGDVFRKLLRNDRKSISEKYIADLNNILNDIDQYGNLVDRNLTKAGIFSCLAEYNQTLNQKISEEYYIAGNKLISDLQRDSLYNRQDRTKKIIKIFDDIDLNNQSLNIPRERGDGLIFVIGMPRSGTTLTESILSTADDCVTGGEKVFFHIQCSPLITNYEKDNFNIKTFEELGENYLEIIDIQRKGKKYFVDKLPENYLYYGFIKTALPGAKFIHVYRDPWDNAISLFKQNFAKELFYASTFFGIALEYANYEHIMSVWKACANNDILDLNYQDLVTNTNGEIEKIWKFCNFKGQFDESKRKKHFAQTASKHQVTKGIYSSSLKKEEFLDYKDTFNQDLEAQRLFWKS